MSQADPAPTPRLTSQERIALNLIAASAKPWNGQAADSNPRHAERPAAAGRPGPAA